MYVSRVEIIYMFKSKTNFCQFWMVFCDKKRQKVAVTMFCHCSGKFYLFRQKHNPDTDRQTRTNCRVSCMSNTFFHIQTVFFARWKN